MRVLRDIPYAEARVGYAGGRGPMRTITLAYDAYLPEPGAAPAPAVVLAFGGAFHRGSKEDDSFPGAGDTGTNTAIAEYCRHFAAEGFACFSVAYRLAGDEPHPGDTPVLTRPEAVPMGRIAEVRRLMGLPPATALDMAGVMEAAVDDMVAAAGAVRARAAEHGVDPARIVLGGWSAGARCALYAAYGAGVPCAGVVALSGAVQAEDVAAYVTPGRPHPPLLLVTAERDLGYVVAGAEPTVAAFRAAGVAAEHRRVPGHDHWYPAEAVTDAGSTVQAAVRAALRRWTGH